MRSPAQSPRRSPIRLLRLVLEVALLTVIGVGLGTAFLGRVLPALGHPVLVVAGPSMEPAIGVGSAVILEDVAATDLRAGDVVSLRSGSERAVFTHRVVRVLDHQGAPWIETKGDANPSADPSITPVADVIGRVTVVLPAAGYVLTLLSAPIGVTLILSVGATLMVATWLLQSIEDDRRRAAARGVIGARNGAPEAGVVLAPPLVPARAAVAAPSRRRSTPPDAAAKARQQRRLARARATGRGA